MRRTMYHSGKERTFLPNKKIKAIRGKESKKEKFHKESERNKIFETVSSFV